jgi:hypothetical protein
MTTIEITITPDFTLCHHFQRTGGAPWQSDDHAGESETSLEVTLTIRGTIPGSVYRYSLADNSCREAGREFLLRETFAC